MNEEEKEKRAKFIPWLIVLFFVVIAVADAIFVYIATSTHTGVVTNQAYEKGLAYNEVLAKVGEQEDLGWSVDVHIDEGRQLLVSVKDQKNQVIQGAQVKVYFFRPTMQGFDMQKKLTENNGRYTTTFDLPLKGQWEVRVAILWNKQNYQIHKRVLIQ